MRKAYLVLGVSLALCALPASAQRSDWKQKLGLQKTDEVGESDTIAGLKEALSIGAEKAVQLTGREDGYFNNEAIKILMPEKLRKVQKGLSRLGQEEMVDSFVLSMNRAAEKAAPFAKDIFWDAIKEMKFDDGRKILTGGDTAATDYLKANTNDKLTAAFLPVVKESMEAVGVTQQYKNMMGRFESLPFAKNVTFDVDQYTVEQALNGLFHMLAEQETAIRTDPAARVTDLLKTVFAKGG